MTMTTNLKIEHAQILAPLSQSALDRSASIDNIAWSYSVLIELWEECACICDTLAYNAYRRGNTDSEYEALAKMAEYDEAVRIARLYLAECW